MAIIRKGRMLLSIWIFFVCFQAFAIPQSLPVSTYIAMQELRKTGKLEQAITAGEKHLQSYPNDADVMLLMGLIYYQKKDFNTAYSYFNKTLKISPNYLDAQLALVRVFIAQNKMPKAQELLLKIGNKYPSNHDVIALQQFIKKIAIQKKQNAVSVLPKIITVKSPIKSPLPDIQKLRATNRLQEAIKLAQRYLEKYPQDGDILLQLGLIYFQQKHYKLAEKYFQHTLKIAPNYFDAKVALFKTYVAMHKYRQAELVLKQIEHSKQNSIEAAKLRRLLIQAQNFKELEKIDQNIKKDNLDVANSLINKSLYLHPNDPDFMGKKVDLYTHRHQYAMAADRDKKILGLDADNKTAKQSFKDIANINPYFLYGINETGVNNTTEYVTLLNAVWEYTTIYYARDGDMGRAILSMNNASRFRRNASQIAINLYPVLNSHLYLNIEGGFAQQPILFPKAYGGGEAFFSGKLAEISGGFRHASILSPDIAFTQYTVSISKEWRDFWLSFRPIHYVPFHGGTSLLYTATLIKYFKTKDVFAKLMLASGTAPNLANLLTVDFLVVREDIITGSIQFPIYKHQVLLSIGGDYQHWLFPSGRIWNISGMLLGLNFRFEDFKK